jgi:hypothetical protein
VSLEVDDWLNFAVGWDSAGKVLPAHSRGAHLHHRLSLDEEENHDHDDNGEQNPEPRAGLGFSFLSHMQSVSI